MSASILTGLKRAFGRTSSSVRYECRRCGTGLESAADRCVECGAEDVARYDLG